MDNKIPFSEWEKIDLRVGTIITVNDHPKADKLYILEVDLGEERPRTIVAGLKKIYTKEELTNKQGIFIANLEPVVLRGIQSEGMTLAGAAPDESVIAILTPEKRLPAGSKVR